MGQGGIFRQRRDQFLAISSWRSVLGFSLHFLAASLKVLADAFHGVAASDETRQHQYCH